MTVPLHLEGTDYWLVHHEKPEEEPALFGLPALLVGITPAAEPTRWGTHWMTEFTPSFPGESSIHDEAVNGSGEHLVRARYRDHVVATPRLLPGDFYPRVWRNGIKWSPRTPWQHQKLPAEAVTGRRSAAEAVLSLLDQLAAVFDVVSPHSNNRDAHGPAMRRLLMLACGEVEAAWKGILDANLPTSKLQTKYDTNQYVNLAAPMRLPEYSLVLARHAVEWGEVVPFSSWSATAPTETLRWYAAYNAVKHNRERDGHLGSLEMVVSAVAAAWLMLLAQFGCDSEQFGDVVRHRCAFEFTAEPKWSPDELYFPPGGRGFRARLMLERPREDGR